MLKNHGLSAGVILGSLALVATLLVSGAEAADRPLAELPVPMIRVTGEGQASLAPDMAVLTLGVVREGENARDTLTANNEAMRRITEALVAAGIEKRDLQTSDFSISPRYREQRDNERRRSPEIIGYSVSNRLTVRVRDLDRLGAIIDETVDFGVNSGGNISFTNADPEDAIREARAAAVKDARSRASVLAEAAGVELGKLIELSEHTSRPRPQGLEMARMSAADAVPVQSGENTYTVTVQAGWAIAE